MFLCPKCKNEFQGFQPEKCLICGYEVPQIDSIYNFCDDPPISLEVDGHKYLGYEYVGENFEPKITLLESTEADYGLYGACSRKLIELLGKECVVLDLGAGLGSASIPLALAGAKTIAADISQVMLSIAAKRASAECLNDNLICARMNAYNLPISDNSIDAIVELAMLHQVDNPEVVVKEILRVLKPDGIFVRYGCTGLSITDEQKETNRKCNEMLNDIRNFYQNSLIEYGYTGLPFSSWEKVTDYINQYFDQPEIIQTDFVGIWTGKMQKEIYKLQTRASGSAQLIPDDIHNNAWEKTNEYAENKYGKDYRNTPGYSKFTGPLEIYRIKVK
ncbi:MAG: class I SAM-dependent methyltransferase [Saccharofermentanales bacterium]